MKKLGAVLIIVLFIAAVTLSFFLGDYVSDKNERNILTNIFRLQLIPLRTKVSQLMVHRKQ